MIPVPNLIKLFWLALQSHLTILPLSDWIEIQRSGTLLQNKFYKIRSRFTPPAWAIFKKSKKFEKLQKKFLKNENGCSRKKIFFNLFGIEDNKMSWNLFCWCFKVESKNILKAKTFLLRRKKWFLASRWKKVWRLWRQKITQHFFLCGKTLSRVSLTRTKSE